MTLAVAIFVIALGAIASERVDRTKVALLGAALVVVSQTIDQEEAIEAIDFNTLGLLAGMMLQPDGGSPLWTRGPRPASGAQLVWGAASVSSLAWHAWPQGSRRRGVWRRWRRDADDAPRQ